MAEHRWSGWPGAWCLDCGCDDPREVALLDGMIDDEGRILPGVIKPEQMECPESGSKRLDPYASVLNASIEEDNV